MAKIDLIRKIQQEGGSLPSSENKTEQTGQAAKGYYALPENLGSRTEELNTAVQNAKRQMLQVEAEAREATNTANATANDLRFLQSLAQCTGTDKVTLTGNISTLQKQYREQVLASAMAQEKYEPAFNNYKSAVTIYNDYVSQEKTTYDNWRSTIRDESAIAADLETVNAQLEAMYERTPVLKSVADPEKWKEAVAAGRADADTLVLVDELQQLLQRKELLEEESQWQKYFSYEDLRTSEDFTQNSKHVKQKREEQTGGSVLQQMFSDFSDDNSGWEDPLYEAVNGNEEAKAYLRNQGAAYYGSDNPLGSLLGRVDKGKTEAKEMTPAEVEMFNYLYATQGKGAAHGYYNYLQSSLNERQRKAAEAAARAHAQEKPVLASIESLVTSPLKGLSLAGQVADYIGDGEIDQNAGYNAFSYTNTAARSAVSDKIAQSGKWGEVGSFAYNTVMSRLDSLLNMAIGGGNKALSLAIMASGAAGDQIIEAKDRGLSDDQAVALGTIAGAAEAITENMSIDALLNKTGMGKSAVGYILQNSLAEGFEEGGSNLINTMADLLISKNKSQWVKSIDAYKEQGMDEGAAFAKAMADQAASLGLDVLGGMLSGGGTGAVSAAGSAISAASTGAQIGKQNLDIAQIQDMVNFGLQAEAGSRANYLAQQFQQKLARGEALSDYDLGRLAQANIQAGVDATKNAAPKTTNSNENVNFPENSDGVSVSNLQESIMRKVQEQYGTANPNLAGRNEEQQSLNSNAVTAADVSQEQNNVTENGGFVTHNQENVISNVAFVTQNTTEPQSVAAMLRREQNLNGGIINGNTETTGTGVAATEAAGGRISDGSIQRDIGASAGKQTGSLESSSTGRILRADRNGAAITRQNLAGSLRLEKVSSLDLGLQNGTENKTVRIMPQEHWDAEMQEVAQRVYNETGKQVTYFVGRLQVWGAEDQVGYVRGVITGDRILLQADNLRATVEQLGDHETYHAKSDFFSRQMLNDEIRKHIVETFSEEQFRKVLDKYIQGLRGVIDMNNIRTGEDYATVMQQIEEEIFADAYAGINAFGAGAAQFTEAVNQKMDELHVGKLRSQENGTAGSTGPPVNVSKQKESTAEYGGVRYSLDYSTAVKQLDEGTLDRTQNTHLLVLDHTPQIYIDKAGAKNQKIITGWDIAYLAMKKNGDIPGNYHGLGQNVMRMIPHALQDPLYIVKQNNGRIVAVTEITVKGNRSVIVSIEFDTFKSTTQDGNHESENYNLILTLLDAKPNYLKNTIFGGEIVYNKNNEDPANFILRLKSLKKAVPNDDLAESSNEKLAYESAIVKERFSADDGSEAAEFRSVQQRMQRMNARGGILDEDLWLRSQLGQEGAERFRQWQQDTKVHGEIDEETQQQKRQKRQQERKIERAAARIKADSKPKQESQPVIAKQELRKTILEQFSIPAGSRAELSAQIDNYAERLLKNGSITENDRKAFFDRMYEAGVMTVQADDYFAQARRYLSDGRIYVPDSVVADFGDDWESIRRRAFAAGFYVTRTQNMNGHSVAGIDMWNGELATEFPGLFDSEETDQRAILERILQVAEEGKDEKLSFAQFAAQLTGGEDGTEQEFIDSMERQLDWALRTFAEKAQLEIKLRDRSAAQVAREREYANARRSREFLQDLQRQAKEREERQEKAQRARDQKALQQLQQQTLKTLQWLNKNRYRAPEELKGAWDEVLGDIDLYAVGAANEMRWSDKHNATWKDLAQMYKDAQKNDPNFLPSKELEVIVARLDDTKIGEMDLAALTDLYKAAVGLRTEFYNRNNVLNDEINRLFTEVYSDAKQEIESAPGGYTGGIADKFLNLEQLTPMNVLQRMAGWNPDSTFYSMAKQLEHGERDIRAYKVNAQKMLQEFLTEYEDWVKRADGQGKDAIWYEIEVPELMELGMGNKPIFGDTVKVYMTPAQKVHMYLESKNLDNLRHMTGGRTFADKELYSKGKRQEALSQGRTVRLAPETVRKIVSDLTHEEMELANVLDQYYNTFATQEINRVSNILHGYDKAMGKNYAPIYTNRNYTKAEFGVFDQTAEGVGNLKGRQYAVNPSYNISAFDAFERHVDQTARYCGMAIPARNWTTLMNWREKNNSTGDVITHKWGEESKKYITDLLTVLQAGDDIKADSISKGVSKLQSNYISAVFGANPSIVLKQLGSIPLASAYLGAKNVPTPTQIAGIDRSLIAKYTQELEWRTMGYSTPETKQLKDNPNWTQTNKVFKFAFGGGAITATDGWAASVLWPWAENKVRTEHPELEIGTKEQIDSGESAFYKKVAEEFDAAVSRSQSVSDEIHQGSLRKSKNPFARTFTLFRSDAAQTYNTLRQKIGEARYYASTGAKEQEIRAAKSAVGSAFVAMLMNAAWAEAISFLMALWKNKGKYYRDEEEELTLGSVAGEMVSGVIGSFAGVVTGGEEIFELIGNILTGDTWYGIEVAGMEQLNDMIDTLRKAGSDMRDVVAGGWDIVKNRGHLGKYMAQNTRKIIYGIKEIAEAGAMYVTGLPANNLEAYLLGAVKWISPELGAAYDDLLAEVKKSDLAGTEGDVLQARAERLLHRRGINAGDEAVQAIATLYEAGHKTAVPSDIPTSVSVDGEKHTLGAYQQQVYNTIWSGIVGTALEEIISSESFAKADQKTQAKMLNNLYSYAAEQAKAELFDEYELDSTAEKNLQIVSEGATVAQCVAWNTITVEMKAGEKAGLLAEWDMQEKAKRAIFLYKISGAREETIGALDKSGVDFDDFLQIYEEYGRIDNLELSESEKAVEFSHWVNRQGFSSEQADLIKNELVYYNMAPASAGKYDKLVTAGTNAEDAYKLTEELNQLEPLEGTEKVSNVQRWRTCVDFSSDVSVQMAALRGVMGEEQYAKVEIANSFGVDPDAYVTLQEVRTKYDSDGNGSYTQAEIKAAIDTMGVSTEQKAVLWQLSTGSTSAKNNPYSTAIGSKVLAAKQEQKTAAEEPKQETLSFSEEIMRQLTGG